MAETEHDPTADEVPLTPAQAAKMLNVTYRSVFRLIGLEWVEYETVGSSRPIRRVTPASVRRLLARRRGQ
jgi:hypothetical protein